MAGRTRSAPLIRVVKYRKDRPVVTISLNLAAIAAKQVTSEVGWETSSKFALSAKDECVVRGQWHGVLAANGEAERPAEGL